MSHWVEPKAHECGDAIANEVRIAAPWGTDLDDARYMADEVLAMPEMQAVRKALYSRSGAGDRAWRESVLLGMGLPPAIVAWVLGDAP